MYVMCLVDDMYAFVIMYICSYVCICAEQSWCHIEPSQYMDPAILVMPCVAPYAYHCGWFRSMALLGACISCDDSWSPLWPSCLVVWTDVYVLVVLCIDYILGVRVWIYVLWLLCNVCVVCVSCVFVHCQLCWLCYVLGVCVLCGCYGYIPCVCVKCVAIWCVLVYCSCYCLVLIVLLYRVIISVLIIY